MAGDGLSTTTQRSRSSRLTGGEGFTYEDTVVAYYLAALLREERAQGCRGSVVRVAVQQDRQGEALDDLIVDAEEAGEASRLSLQVKSAFAISAADSEFKAIIEASLATRRKSEFQVGKDRYGFIVEEVAVGRFGRLIEILRFAEASPTSGDFVTRFQQGGEASLDVIALRDELRPLIGAADDAEHDFYRHFVGYRFDNLAPGGDAYVQLANRLGEIVSQDGVAATEILCRHVRLGEGKAQVWTRNSLLAGLNPRLSFMTSPSYRADVTALASLARSSCAEIRADIAGLSIDRAALVERAEAETQSHSFTNISGLPGCGKSVVLRRCVERALEKGPVLFLTSDRLEGASWRSFARSQGLRHLEAEAILGEIGAAGVATLFIDGIDRISPSNRGIIADLLNGIERDPALSHWRVLATSRDQGLEVLRSWISSALYARSGIGNVDVGALSDEEAEVLSEQHPALKPLLSGADAVQEIARRPFFAAVIADQAVAMALDTTPPPQTEAELIGAWWRAGGYNLEPTAADGRQRALLKLAEAGAPTLGKGIHRRSISSETAAQLEGLRRDKIVDVVVEGSQYKFAHDIFFEWSFFRLLIDEGEAWPGALTKAGEPPLLARIVGLLAQSEYEKAELWAAGYAALSELPLRPQWRRSWLLGPASSTKFKANAQEFDELLNANDHALLEKFLVWFQAERTIPSPIVLQHASGEIDSDFLVRAADMLGWPSDLAQWQRVLSWIFGRSATLPAKVLPYVVELFSVWQNMCSGFRNGMSGAIITVCDSWLTEIEGGRTPRWKDVKDDTRSAVASQLRSIILKAATAYTEPAARALDRILAWERRSGDLLATVFALTHILGTVFPEKLAELVRVEVIKELPKDKKERKEREDRERHGWLRAIREKPEAERTPNEQRALEHRSMFIAGGEDRYELDDVGIDRHHSSFYPAAAGHEPFDTLFKEAPAAALKLVRDLSNHASRGWLQVHELRRRKHGTPLPLEVEFPWGKQTFWGDERTYGWYIGQLGPQSLESAWLAQTHWAHTQLDSGADTDALIQQVTEGHENVAALGLAASLAVERNERSPAVLALLAAQRLWVMDINRQAQEAGRGLVLMGMDPRHQMTAKQRAADDYLMGRSYRERSLKDISYLYALSNDEHERESFVQQLARFPDELPYAYAEEVGDADFEAYSKERATAWIEFARKENYGLVRTGADTEQAQLVYRDPTPKTPERQQQIDESQNALRDFTVVAWANKSLSDRTIQSNVTLAAAIEFARFRDQPDLFQSVAEAGSGMTQACVASVAAMFFRFGGSEADREWAWTIVERLALIKDERGDERHGRNPADPRPFYIAALYDDVRGDAPRETSMPRLFAMAADDNANIAQMAMAGLLDACAMPEFISWNAGILATELFSTHVGSYDDREEARAKVIEHKRQALDRALVRLAQPGVFGDLVTPPPAWVEVTKQEKRRRRRSGVDADWTYPGFDFNPQAAGPIVRAFPVEKWAENPALQTQVIAYVHSLVLWTSERMFPSFAEDPEDSDSRLYEWINELARLVARVVVLLPADEAWEQLVEPIAKHRHRDVLHFVGDLTESITCRFIYDAATIQPNAKKILTAVMRRMLLEPDLSPTSWRPGERIDRHLGDMLKSFLLVSVEDAPGASRFANGDWKDLPQMLPLIEELILAIGWIDLAMDKFLTMCVRAGENVPIELFARLVGVSMDSAAFRLERWNAAGIPAQVAGVVQRLADAKHPLPVDDARSLLILLDRLVDMGDRRAAALEQSEHFRNIQLPSLA